MNRWRGCLGNRICSIDVEIIFLLGAFFFPIMTDLHNKLGPIFDISDAFNQRLFARGKFLDLNFFINRIPPKSAAPCCAFRLTARFDRPQRQTL
jgi:hypothetical protein